MFPGGALGLLQQPCRYSVAGNFFISQKMYPITVLGTFGNTFRVRLIFLAGNGKPVCFANEGGGRAGCGGLNVSDRGALGLLKQPRRYSVVGSFLVSQKMYH
jgi:hypothetical protein